MPVCVCACEDVEGARVRRVSEFIFGPSARDPRTGRTLTVKCLAFPCAHARGTRTHTRTTAASFAAQEGKADDGTGTSRDNFAELTYARALSSNLHLSPGLLGGEPGS